MENIGSTFFIIRLMSAGILVAGPILYLVLSLLISYWFSRWIGIVMAVGCGLSAVSKIPFVLNSLGIQSPEIIGNTSMILGATDRIGSILFAFGFLALLVTLKHRIKDKSSRDEY